MIPKIGYTMGKSPLVTKILEEHRGGSALMLASNELAKLVRAVNQTSKSGELTIKMKISPMKGDETAKSISISVKANLPTVDLPMAIFFADEDGSLHRDDPRQHEMRFAKTDGRSVTIDHEGDNDE